MDRYHQQRVLRLHLISSFSLTFSYSLPSSSPEQPCHSPIATNKNLRCSLNRIIDGADSAVFFSTPYPRPQDRPSTWTGLRSRPRRQRERAPLSLLLLLLLDPCSSAASFSFVISPTLCVCVFFCEKGDLNKSEPPPCAMAAALKLESKLPSERASERAREAESH